MNEVTSTELSGLLDRSGAALDKHSLTSRESTTDDTVADTGSGSGHGRRKKKFNVNEYVVKKTIAEGLFDTALLTADATLLRLVIDAGPTIIRFYFLLICLISISLTLQIVTAMLLFAKLRVNIENDEERERANGYNDCATLLVCFIAVLNIMIGVFSSGA
ncbi:ninjurin-2-like [Glandiceps talaboti]